MRALPLVPLRSPDKSPLSAACAPLRLGNQHPLPPQGKMAVATGAKIAPGARSSLAETY